MRARKNLMFLMESIYPVLPAAMLVPALCLFDPARVDAVLIPMFLAGLTLMPASLIFRAAAGRADRLLTYLGLCAAGVCITLLAGTLAVRAFPGGVCRRECLAGITAGCIWFAVSSARVRMKNKRREKARKENDISWNEEAVVSEKPGPCGIWFFAAVYVLSLLHACPVLCDASLAGGMLCMMMFLLYRNLESTGRFMEQTKHLANVPGRKMQRLRTGRCLMMLGGIALIFAISMSGAPLRRYRDLRFLSFSGVPDPDKLYFPTEGTDPMALLPDWVREPVRGAAPPAVFRYLDRFLPWIAAAGILLFCMALIKRFALDFKGIPEENGDIAMPLTEDTSRKILKDRTVREKERLTEREQVRRRYRRTIRRYRKGQALPGAWETPAQIEEGTVFPEDFDAWTLHESYEKARYGPSDS